VIIDVSARVKYKLAASVAGVLVEEATPNSVSAGRGLAAGNVILKIRDTRVATADQVTKALVAASATGHRNALLLVQKKDGQHWVTVPLGTGH
jgi:S1-C subfamily serine protease